jgi:hypothetical protein
MFPLTFPTYGMKLNIPFLTSALCALCLLCGSLLLPGCTTAGRPDTMLIAQVAVTYGVGKVLENNPDYAGRVAAIAAEVGKAAGGEASTVSAVMQLARTKIDWSELTPADATLVNLLLITVEVELTKRVEAGVLSPEKALLVQEVAGWIENAARAYVPASGPTGPLAASPAVGLSTARDEASGASGALPLAPGSLTLSAGS